MPFRVRLTIALILTLTVCAAMGQDPYAPPQYAPAPPGYGQAQPQQGLPPVVSRYPLPQQPPQQQAYPQQPYPQQPAPNQNIPNQSLRYPLPPNAPNPQARSQATGQLAPIVTPQTVQRAAPPAAARSVQPATNYVAASAQPVQPTGVLFAPGQIMAQVGDKSILYADVAPTVNMRLEPILAKARNEAERQAMEAAYREPLTKNVIEQLIFNKLLLMEFERGMPSEIRTDAKKRAEAEGKLKKQIRSSFDMALTNVREKIAKASPEDLEKAMKQDSTMVRLAVLMKERHLESPGELDAVLRQYGTSLDQQIKDYGEYMMGMEAAQSHLGLGRQGKGGKGGPAGKKEITHQDLIDYYQAHQADYFVAAKARFEILTAKPARLGGDRQAARALIEQMGNEVLLGGTPLPAVARKYSHDPRSMDGGQYDWVTPGSLASKVIDQTVFTIEVDRLSQVLEDENGFHILRVLERKDAGQLSFRDEQPNIREAIEKERLSAEQQKYLTDVRKRTKVWTIFDPPEGSGTPPPAGAQRR